MVLSWWVTSEFVFPVNCSYSSTGVMEGHLKEQLLVSMCVLYVCVCMCINVPVHVWLCACCVVCACLRGVIGLLCSGLVWLTGFFVNAPYSIITTAISADLVRTLYISAVCCQ